MGKRLMVAVIYIPLIFVIFFLLPPLATPIAIGVLSAIAVHEALWNTNLVRITRIAAFSIVLAVLIPLWSWFGENMKLAMLGLLIYFTLLFAEAIASNYTVTAEKMGAAFFFTITIPYFLASFSRIRQMELGLELMALPLVIAFTSDAFALFAGMLFGKHKLAPKLSPKKTVEGAVGGFLGAIVCTLAYGLIMQKGFGCQVNYLYLVVYGGLGSLISQLGDISFSYVKRQCGIKDFGTIFPGHGGVLDRFDSVIFCAPLTEVLLFLLPAIVR